MGSDKSWFYNARTAYWNALNPGIRFGVIFNMKNNNIGVDGGKAGFIARVNTKCGDMLTSQIFDEIKQGVFRSDEYKEKIMPFLIDELGLTQEEFYATEKVRPPKSLPKSEGTVKANPVPVAVTKPAESEVYIQGKTEVETPATKSEALAKPKAVPSSPNKPKLCIDNWTEEGIIVVLKEEADGTMVLNVFPNDGENMKKSGAEWVPPVDVIANGYSTVVRRKELYKAVKVCKK